MEKLLPILSNSFKDILKALNDKNSNQIAKDLLRANELTELYNKYYTISDYDTALSNLKQFIDEIITDEVRALSIRDNLFEVSFTPKGKELIYTEQNTWRRDGRQTGKPARIVQRLLRNKYKNRELEIFNNLLKSEVLNCGTFKIVSGDDIEKYYNVATYLKESGTLGNSCMRYDDCSDYFEIYKDVAKMLICLKHDKLIGRAIIWELKDKILMDRVYVTDDYVEEQFIEYAKSNNWYYRENQSLLDSGHCASWLTPEDNYNNPIYLKEVIKCPRRYIHYPYIDSFRYFDIEENTISTIPEHGNARMDDTNGLYEQCEYKKCMCCGHQEKVWEDDDDETFHYCEYLNQLLCNNCCEWNSYMSDYVPIDVNTVNVIWDDFEDIELPEYYVKARLIYSNQFRSSETYFIKIGEVYYHRHCFKWNFDLNKYVLIENEN